MTGAVSTSSLPKLNINTTKLNPGLRLAVGVSGGADSVALLCALAEQAAELGIVLHVAHLHHGLRGAEADDDLEFVRELAERFGLPFHEERVNVAQEAKKSCMACPSQPSQFAEKKDAESIEEAARRLRYGWFRQLMASGDVDAVATAHTLDDQAETVLGKLLRGAWTEGISGIYPNVSYSEGLIVRPMLAVSRHEVEDYLSGRGQAWREDSSNRDPVYTRNRLRYQLLPHLEAWNPQIRERLAQMAELAREEEAYWSAQVAWLAPQLILPGNPVRGGGRSANKGLALDQNKLAAQNPAMQRRLLRFAAESLGVVLDFAGTETLRSLAVSGRAGQKRQLAQGLRAERSYRELHLSIAPGDGCSSCAQVAKEHSFTLPGEIEAWGFGVHLKVDGPEGKTALLRNWAPGDRVRLRHSSGPRKVKEVLERLKISGSGRAFWPVLELDKQIVWMQGVDVESMEGVTVSVTRLDSPD